MTRELTLPVRVERQDTGGHRLYDDEGGLVKLAAPAPVVVDDGTHTVWGSRDRACESRDRINQGAW